ncbi:MAG: AAA family ATPase, partial [Candidatus Omnitrophota bacterium]
MVIILLSVAAGILGGSFFASAYKFNLLLVFYESYKLTFLLAALFSYGTGFIGAKIFLVVFVGISEIGYQILLHLRGMTKKITGVTVGRRSYKNTLPYDKEVIKAFDQFKENQKKRADQNIQIEGIKTDMFNSLRDEKIRKDAQGVLIDNIHLAYTNQKDKNYVPEDETARLVNIISTVKNLKKVAISWLIDDPALLVGETGVGKTSLVRYLMYLTGSNFRRFNLNGQTDKMEFIGGYKPNREGKLRWVPGILIQAMKNGYTLVIDEINLADSSVLERMNSLLDDDKSLRISEHNGEKWIQAEEYDQKRAEVSAVITYDEQGTEYLLTYSTRFYRIHPDFRLFATMNPADYAGRKILSPALMNRYRIKWIDNFRRGEWMLMFYEGIKDRQERCILDDDSIARFYFAHDRIQELCQKGEIGAQQGDRFYFTTRNAKRVAKRLKARVEEKENLLERELELEEVIRILVEEIIEVYGDGIRTEADRAIFMECIWGPFGHLQIEENRSINTSYPEKVYFGDIALDVSKEEGSYVPGPDSVMENTVTTLKYLRKLAKVVKMDEKALLVGDTGAGKTSLIRYLAYLTKNNFIRMNLDAQTDTSELIGHYIPKEGTKDEFQWVYGKLVDAMEKGYWILLDELNLAEPEILERINSLLDDDGSLVITELENETWLPQAVYLKKLIRKVAEMIREGRRGGLLILRNEAESILRKEGFRKINPNFRLFTAMNPERYCGRNRISIAMRNKLTEIWVSGIMESSELKEIVSFYLGVIPERDKVVGVMVDFYEKMQIAGEGEVFTGGGVEQYQFSIRELKVWAKYIRTYYEKLGLWASVISGAIYIYYDRLSTVTDQDKFKELLLTVAVPGVKKHIEQFTSFAVSRDNEGNLNIKGGFVNILNTSILVNVNEETKEYVSDPEQTVLVSTAATLINLEKVARSVLLNEPPLLIGPTGAGKTSLIRYLAFLTGNKFKRFNLNVQTEKGDFIGSHKPGKDGNFVWEDKILVDAMKKGYWLVLDEINLAPSQVIERINSLLDDDGFLVITEHCGEIYLKYSEFQRRKNALKQKFLKEGLTGDSAEKKALEEMAKKQYYQIHKDFRLFATMNPSEYAGRQVFSPALMNRFRVKWIDELPLPDIRIVICGKYGFVPDFVDQMLNVYTRIRLEIEKADVENECYTIRHLLRWSKRIKFALEKGWPGGMNRRAGIEA